MISAIKTGAKWGLAAYAGVVTYKLLGSLSKAAISLLSKKVEKKAEEIGNELGKKVAEEFPDFEMDTYVKAAAEAVKRKEEKNG